MDSINRQQEEKNREDLHAQKAIEKIKELEAPPSNTKTSMTWKKGTKGTMYFAKVKEISPGKSKKDNHEAEFIVVEEEGKLKIDGTLSDSN